MIPRTEYILIDSIGNVITDELLQKYHTSEEVMRLNHWIHGKPCTMINEEIAIYAWDYEWWLSSGKPGYQGSDWD